eukprot:360133-Chlamydomonas_euryale.AAC.2
MRFRPLLCNLLDWNSVKMCGASLYEEAPAWIVPYVRLVLFIFCVHLSQWPAENMFIRRLLRMLTSARLPASPLRNPAPERRRGEAPTRRRGGGGGAVRRQRDGGGEQLQLLCAFRKMPAHEAPSRAERDHGIRWGRPAKVGNLLYRKN